MQAMVTSKAFWRTLDQLVAGASLVVDRPKGAPHPRHPSFLYPLDYGYLAGTRAADGDGVDVWIGSLPDRAVTGIVCTVDLNQKDAEIKILLGCTPQEARQALATHNTGDQAGLLIERAGPGGSADHG